MLSFNFDEGDDDGDKFFSRDIYLKPKIKE